MAYIFSQTMTIIAFVMLIIVLFNEKTDYLTYSFLALLIGGLATAYEIPEARKLETYIKAIDWEVVLFLIFMFTIVEILNEAKLFHEIALRIVQKYRTNIRLMFYVICIVSTLSASIIEDLSVAIIFIPIILLTCEELEINPAPFLLGMTICINLASTLTPFGSAQNIMIANYFDLNAWFFLKNFGPYFVSATAITLIFLDHFVLTKSIKTKWTASCEMMLENKNENSKDDIKIEKQENSEEPKLKELSELEKLRPSRKSFIKNSIGFIIFVVLLLTIHQLYLAGLIGMLMFTMLNPITMPNGDKKPRLSKYLSKVDYKLIYFFICLFILVHLMEMNGLISLIEHLIEQIAIENIFLLSIIIMVITSLFSGILDNAPVTIMFLPIIGILTENSSVAFLPLIIAFVLGINLGGNFLPQGSAADMMTLEMAQQHCVTDITYKRLTIIGAKFALLHLLIGVGYLAIIIYVL